MVYETGEKVIYPLRRWEEVFDHSHCFDTAAMTEANAIQNRREREEEGPLVGDYLKREGSVQTIATVWEESIQLATPTSFLGITEEGKGIYKGGARLPISKEGLVKAGKKINRFRVLPMKDYREPRFVEIPVIVWAHAGEK